MYEDLYLLSAIRFVKLPPVKLVSLDMFNSITIIILFPGSLPVNPYDWNQTVTYYEFFKIKRLYVFMNYSFYLASTLLARSISLLENVSVQMSFIWHK